MAIVTRFAPAPTGFLHLGHVLNAIYVWGAGRALGGRVLLRVEDHDRQRSRPEFERAMLDDLDWLGFAPDDPPTDAFRGGACRSRQSDRGDIYEAALTALRDQDLVYACDCSRRASGAAGEDVAGEEPRYRGTCARKGLREQPGLALRVRLPAAVERFDDLRHGRQEQCPAEQCGDLLVRDRAGNWTYQFAAVVDDHEQGVTTGGSRRRSPGLDRTADSTGPDAWSRHAALLPASPADHEDNDAEAEQVGRRHGHQGAS